MQDRKMLPVHTVPAPQENGMPFWMVACLCAAVACLGYGFGLADKGSQNYNKGFDDGYKQAVYEAYKTMTVQQKEVRQ